MSTKLRTIKSSKKLIPGYYQSNYMKVKQNQTIKNKLTRHEERNIYKYTFLKRKKM